MDISKCDGVVIVGKMANEYFCCSCKQLRLSLDGASLKCGNCGQKDLVTGPIGTLDKEALIRKVKGYKS